jgi:tetratricopeptide (TPR) repeat protein
LQRFLTLSTSSHPIWRKRGLEGAAETYRLLGRYKDYLVYARKAAFTHTANDYLQISNAYLLLNDHPNRIAYLKRALAADPGLAGRVHRELGALAERGNRLDEAEREYEAAIAADPDNPWYYRSLARVFLARRNSGGRLARAIQMAERAVALAPDSPEDFHQLGIAHAAAGNLEKAVQAFQHAIDLQPDYQPSYLYLARTLIRKGDRARGERMMQLYRHYEARSLEKQRLANRVRQNPRDASALTALANLHAGEGDYARAADLLRRARRLAPSDARTRSGLTRMENLLARAVVMPD